MITAPEELDALPKGTVVACLSKVLNLPICIVFQKGSNFEGGQDWTTPEAIGQIPSEAVFEFVALNGFEPKFTILHTPGEA